jgi:putative ABC transport system permease protein
VLLLIVLSTAYPAYRLSVTHPISDLRSGGGFGKNNVGRILLLAQFTISIICISITLVVSKQLKFIQARNPGYDRQNLIVVAMPDRYPAEKNQVIKDEFSKLMGVQGVSFSTFRIAGAGYYRDWYRVEIDGEMKKMMLNEVFFDENFFDVTEIPLVAGRSFDPNRPTDSHEAFIVNETAVREFGWKDPIGKKISYGYEQPEGEKWEGTIIGVVKDFNVYSLHKKIEPLVMRLPWSEWPGNCVHVRINGPLNETITRIKNKYESILPGFLLTYTIVEDLYNNQYQNEKKAFTSLQLSSLVIVLISSFGIFSLSIYMSLRRMKEFGIRKVLGATAQQITILHVGHFIKIALIANAIGLPFAYWLSKRWLNEFAYKTEVNGGLFAWIMIFSFVLVILSAGYSSWKSGRMNPVEVIKID